MKRTLIVVVFLLQFFLCKSSVFAVEEKYVTVVNPVRIAPYTQDVHKNIDKQATILDQKKLPATWLVTFDVLSDPQAVEKLQNLDKKHELGIFLEIGKSVTNQAGVEYLNGNAWHHANSIFLSGYSQGERRKLIDAYFAKFKEVFGYYPTSVGSWWTDSYSLSYMQDKYGIVANLVCADQFSTDGYQIWGQYWGLPYYSSKYHAAIPGSGKDKLGVVNIQWAPRDPNRGYLSSLYSTQDYFTTSDNLDVSYFSKLIDIYTDSNLPIGQITVGLESDFNPKVYDQEFAKQMEIVKKKVLMEDIKPLTMSEFAQKFKSKFENNPEYLLVNEDILNKGETTFWYQSPKYRIGLVYDQTSYELKIRDYRVYSLDFKEPYYETRNTDLNLAINIPSVVDQVSDQNTLESFNLGSLKQVDSANKEIIFSNGKILFLPDKLTLVNVDRANLETIKRSTKIKISSQGDRITIEPNINWKKPNSNSYTFLTPEAKRFIYTKRAAAVLFLILTLSALVFSISVKNKSYLMMVLVPVILIAGVFCLWKANSQAYFIADGELDTLNRLTLMSPGKVLVYSKECLGCSWDTSLKPASYVTKDYVTKYAKHPIVKNVSVFEASDQKTARDEFEASGARYIYITKYAGFSEKVPFSPGDLGIIKVYANANSELWVRK